MCFTLFQRPCQSSNSL